MRQRFLEYLGVEEENLLARLVKYSGDFDVFATLDCIYEWPLRAMKIDEPLELVADLYLFVHYQLYFTARCLLRGHLSEAFASYVPRGKRRHVVEWAGQSKGPMLVR